MADAYATLASGGIHHKPVAITKVVFPDGKSDNLGRNPGKRVLSDGQAYEVTKILHENVLGGTGTHANIGCPAAGKTGTTDNFNDAWFVGYTPQAGDRRSGSATRTRWSRCERARHLRAGRQLPRARSGTTT